MKVTNDIVIAKVLSQKDFGTPEELDWAVFFNLLVRKRKIILDF